LTATGEEDRSEAKDRRCSSVSKGLSALAISHPHGVPGCISNEATTFSRHWPEPQRLVLCPGEDNLENGGQPQFLDVAQGYMTFDVASEAETVRTERDAPLLLAPALERNGEPPLTRARAARHPEFNVARDGSRHKRP
jgi:hypothetical protein